MNRSSVVRCIKDSPGCSKSDIVRYIKEKQMMGRPAVLVHIDKLEREGMIICELEKPNSQLYKIYVNKENKIASTLEELEDFRAAFTELLEKSKDIINNKDYSADVRELGIEETNPDRWTEENKRRFAELERIKLVKIREEVGVLRDTMNAIKQLHTKAKSGPSGNMKPLETGTEAEADIDKKKITEIKLIRTRLEDLDKRSSENLYSLYYSPVELFFIVVDLIFFRSMVKWSEQIKDKEQLAQLYSVAYSKISEIQLYLSEFIKSIKAIPLDPINVLITGRKMSQRFSQQISFGLIVSSYYELGLGPEIENVKDSIIKINQDISELGLIEFSQNVPAILEELDKTGDLLAER